MEIIHGLHTSAKDQPWRTLPDENCWSHFHENFARDLLWDKEVSIAIWKSSVECRPCQAPALLAPAQIIFLVLLLEMWLSMTVDFLNIVANAARWRYLHSTECPSSYYAIEWSILFSVASDFFFFFFFFFWCFHDNSWKVQPIRTKFSHMTFNWNSSAVYKNGHCRSHITPSNRGLLPPSPNGN